MTDILLLLQSSYAEVAALSLLHFMWEGAVLSQPFGFVLYPIPLRAMALLVLFS
jgi:hypothetical protein